MKGQKIPGRRLRIVTSVGFQEKVKTIRTQSQRLKMPFVEISSQNAKCVWQLEYVTPAKVHGRKKIDLIFASEEEFLLGRRVPTISSKKDVSPAPHTKKLFSQKCFFDQKPTDQSG